MKAPETNNLTVRMGKRAARAARTWNNFEPFSAKQKREITAFAVLAVSEQTNVHL